jgi:CRISPR-associated protein Cas4
MSKEELRSVYEERYRKVLNAAVLQSRKPLADVGLDMAEIEKSIWPIMFQELRYRSRLVHSFMLSSRLEGRELWDKLIPKVKPEFYIESEALNLKGRIDRIEDYGQSVVPVEIKTGKAPEGVWPGDRIQVAAYIMLLEDKGMNVQKGSIIYKDGTREIIMNPFLRKDVIDIRDKVAALLASKNIPEKCCDNPKCAACGMRADCIRDVSS